MNLTGKEIKQKKYKESFLLSHLPKNFKFHIKPFYHQLLCTVFALQYKGVGLYLDMGCGKTKIAIDVLRAKGIKKNILIISVNATLYNWVEEINKNSNNEYKTVIVRGSLAEKTKILNEPHDIYIINYEGIFNRKTNSVKSYKQMQSLIINGLDRKWDAIILDESRAIKNVKSQRTKVCMYLATKAKNRIILTGLPIAKSIEEIYPQQFVVDLGETWDDYSKFMERYFYKEWIEFGNKFSRGWGGFVKRFPVFTPKKGALEEVHNCIYKTGIRYTKEECLDLPEKLFQIRYVELEGDQKLFYNKLRNEKKNIVITNKNKHILVTSVLARFAQITGGWLKTEEDEFVEFKNNPKLNELLLLLEEELSKEKIVIFSSYVIEQKQLYEKLVEKKFKVRKIVAGMEPKEISEICSEFNRDSDLQILVVSPRVGGRGLNLTNSKYCIFYSQDADYEIMKQSQDRLHRIGQTHPVTYIKMIARNTCDEKIEQILRENDELSSLVLEGKIPMSKVIEYRNNQFVNKTIGDFI